jgi:hypothetical protein
MPKRKYTDAQRAAMGRPSSKRKQQRLVYDDEDRGRRGANFERQEQESSGEFGGLLAAGVVILFILAILFK